MFDDKFSLTQDKQGLYWLWCRQEEVNLAIRAKSEIEAYKEALDSLAFILQLRTERRDKAEKGLAALQEAFDKVFPPDDDD